MDFEEQFSYLRRKLTMRIQINKSIIFDRFGNIIVLASFAKTDFLRAANWASSENSAMKQ